MWYLQATTIHSSRFANCIKQLMVHICPALQQDIQGLQLAWKAAITIYPSPLLEKPMGIPGHAQASLKFSSGGGQFHPLSLTFCKWSPTLDTKPLSDRDTTMPHQGYTMLVVSIFIYILLYSNIVIASRYIHSMLTSLQKQRTSAGSSRPLFLSGQRPRGAECKCSHLIQFSGARHIPKNGIHGIQTGSWKKKLCWLSSNPRGTGCSVLAASSIDICAHTSNHLRPSRH